MPLSMIATDRTARVSRRRHLACAAVLVLLGACVHPERTAQLAPPAAPASGGGISAPNVQPVPGFLPAPELLRPGKPGEAMLMYRNPAVDLSSFTNVMLDPVRLWTAPGGRLSQLPPKQQQAAANLFYSELLNALQRRCRVVQQPRLNTLRLSFALVDVSAPNQTPTVVAKYDPFTGHSYDPRSIGFDKQVGEFAVSATMEGYAKDLRTGLIAWEGVDKRQLEAVPGAGSVSSWSDVDKIFASWAEDIVAKLKRQQVCP
jgi:hypothetical protein